MNNINVLLGRRIKRLREIHGQTQSELAACAGLSVKHIGELERGRGNPSLRSMQYLAAVLGVTLSELFYFDDEEKSDAILRQEVSERLQAASSELLHFIHNGLKP